MGSLKRLNEEKERSPCLSETQEVNYLKMWGSQRRVLLDVCMVCWGLGTWLGVNGLYVQLPLLVQRLPERWDLPSFMVLAIQFANIGLVIYAVLKRFVPRVPDYAYIYGLLTIGTLALILNAFLYTKTVAIGGTERSVAYLILTFCVALVGCTSSVLFYPYLRNFRDIYLATYLVGEGLSGFIPSILSLIQGTGGEPECSPSGEAVYRPPRFDSTVFLLILGGFSAASLVSFTIVHNWTGFGSERVRAAAAAKGEEAAPPVSLAQPRWVAVLALTGLLNALMNGVLPSVQSYSCMPYGVRAYHLAVSLGGAANPAACLAGVWLRPLSARALAALLSLAAAPLAYMLATALLSPAPPLVGHAAGEMLVVVAWVGAAGALSYARMWACGWARRGGARGMRALGAATQLGSALGSLLLFALVQYTSLFTEAPACPRAL